MRKVWIIVANQAEAKVYRAENVHRLVEHASLYHDNGNQATQDLVSDKQGDMRGAYGTDSREQKTTVKTKEANLFASQIANFLERGINEKDIERFYLIANPAFLGALRAALSSNTARLVEGEITKDLVQAKPEQIREYLPPVL